jgi:hypothetical protein
LAQNTAEKVGVKLSAADKSAEATETTGKSARHQ